VPVPSFPTNSTTSLHRTPTDDCPCFSLENPVWLRYYPLKMQILVYPFSFIIGAVVGSFLNVCIYRLPREMSIVFPASHCPNCGQALAWHDNVPVVSYMLLGGSCRHCGVLISGRYAFVELLTAVMFLAAALRFLPAGADFAAAGNAVIVVAVSSALIVASFVDIERRIIPDEISLGGLAVGVVLSAFFPHLHAQDALMVNLSGSMPTPLFGLTAAITGAAVGGGFIYLAGIVGRVIFKKEAMGLGDVKLMAMVGAFFGPRIALLSIVAGCVFGSVIGLAIMFVLRRKDTRIPFGPYLSMGVITLIFFNDQVLELVHWWQGVVTGGP